MCVASYRGGVDPDSVTDVRLGVEGAHTFPTTVGVLKWGVGSVLGRRCRGGGPS